LGGSADDLVYTKVQLGNLKFKNRRNTRFIVLASEIADEQMVYLSGGFVGAQ
jgi:hypothetical protein